MSNITNLFSHCTTKKLPKKMIEAPSEEERLSIKKGA